MCPGLLEEPLASWAVGGATFFLVTYVLLYENFKVRIVYFVVLLLGTLVTFAATVDLIFPTKVLFFLICIVGASW